MPERPGGPAVGSAPQPLGDGFKGLAWTGGELVTIPDVGSLGRVMEDQLALVWVDVPHDSPELIAAVAERFRLHPLVVEDIVEQNQRAKVELTDDVLHLVMFALSHDGDLHASEIDFVLGERFLLTAHGPEWDPFSSHHFRSGVGAHLSGGPDYVLWAILDAVVDGYFPVFDRIGDDIDELQETVIRQPARSVVERLFRLKRELMTIRHAVSPQREIFNQLTNREMRLVRPERIIYFRDVYDHLIRLTDELDAYRDMVGTTLDAYLTTVNNDLSEVMKRLTAVTVVLAGIAAIGGLFGMSEAPAAVLLQEGGGFWVIVALALALGGIAALYFRRIGWL